VPLHDGIAWFWYSTRLNLPQHQMHPMYRRLYRHIYGGGFRILGTACIFYRGIAHAAKIVELRACVASVDVLDELFSEFGDPNISGSIRPSRRSRSNQGTVSRRSQNAPPQTPRKLLGLETSPFPATSKVQPIHSRFRRQIQSAGEKSAENSTVTAPHSWQLAGRAKSDPLSNASDDVD